MSQAGQFYPDGLISTLTGDVGGAIVPVAGNIDILGGTGVTVTGTAGTLTITVAGVADSFITDSGTAVPDALGDINVLGGANINTTGAGNTVTVILDNDVTLSGQLEANEIESITYITAVANITSTTGNITSVAGDIISGDAITAVGDITTTTGNLNATVGDLNIGGAVSVVGDIVSSAGDVIAQVDVQAVTGNIVSTAGAGIFATTVTAGNGLIATSGGVLASAGNITATLGNVVTSTGSIDSASSVSAVGNITTSTGNVISTIGAGDFATTVTAGGNITSTAGNIQASAGTIQASGNITSTAGNIVTSSGSIDSASTISAVGDITSSTGDLVSTLGDIRAPNGTLYVGTFSATGDIVTSAGDLIATLGDVNAGNQVIAGNGVVANGGVLVPTGDIVAVTGNITAEMNIASINGSINAPNGDITAAYDVVAGADVSSILGDVTAEQGDVLARYDVEAVEGNITAHAGDVITVAGNVVSGGAVIANANLDVTGTVRFRDIVSGGLIADSDGYVTSSLATDTATGFATWTGAGAYFDDTVLGSFEVLRGGTGFIKGILITWAGSQTVTGMTAGNTYLIYMDDTGTIGKTTSFSQATFTDYIVLFECLRDSTGTNIQYTVKENHPYDFQPAVSWWAHETIGTVIENHAQGANITLNGTQKIEIVGADELSDHGLYTDIPDSGGTAEVFMQMLTNGAGKWITYQSSDTFNGYWNSAGTATAPSGTKYSAYTLYISKDDINSAIPTYWAVLDDQEYNNLAGAQVAVSNGTLAVATAELAKLEFAQLGYIIYKQSTTEIIDVIISKTTVSGGTSGGGSSNQASLITTDVTNFDGILSASDTTVQVALETIDDWGASTTDHALLIGNGTGSAIGSLAVGSTGEMLIGNTGADPTWSVTGALTTLNATTVNATTFDTNVAAAGVTLAGTSLLADGTDANIDINITAKGAGQVIIDDLQLTTDLTVPYGGTGASTFTDGGLLVGAAAATIEALAVGGTGTILTGVAGSNPAWTTATYPATAAIGTILVASGANVITTLAPDTAGYVLTDGGAGVAPSWSAASTGTVTSVSGGTNISDSGTATDPIMDLDAAITGMTSITMADTGSIQSTTTNTDTMLIQGYDVDGTAYVPFITITNANDPTCDLNTGVTLGTKYIYRADGTDVPVPDGGTGASTFTDHGVLVGSAAAAITALAVGTNGQLLVGSTGADPVFATVSDGTGITTTLGAGTLSIASTGTTLNNQTGTTYTLVLTDAGKHITLTNAAAIAVTVPTNAAVAFPIGTIISFNQGGAGQATFAGAAPPTLRSADAELTTVKIYSVGCMIKIATDEWIFGGDLEA